MTHAHARTPQPREGARDQDTWNNSGSGIDSQSADKFYLGYHNEHAAADAAFNHIKQDAGSNPDIMKRDLASLADAASHPGQGGNSDWRHRFLGELQDKINGNGEDSKALRRAYGLPEGQQFSFGDGNSFVMPPAPYSPQRSPQSALPGARQGDVPQGTPRQTPDGYDSTGYAQNAAGGQSFYREHDYVQNGIPTKSVRNFEQPTDLKRGDTTITGVNSEITTRNNDNSTEVTLNTARGPVSYHQTTDGKIQYNAPTADQLGVQKPGTPLLPSGGYPENSSYPMTPTADNPNRSTGWLGGDYIPGWTDARNTHDIQVTADKHVDANGRVDTMSVSYEDKALFGKWNSGSGANLDQDVYANRNAASATKMNWNDVKRIDYTWVPEKGAYKMNVVSNAGGTPQAFWTDGKKIYQDW